MSHLTLHTHLMFCEARSLFHPRLPVSLHPSTGTQYKEGKGLLWTSPEDKSSSGPNSGVLLLEAFCFTHTRRNLTLRGLLGSKKSLSKYRHDINTEFSFQSCHYLYSHHLCFLPLTSFLLMPCSSSVTSLSLLYSILFATKGVVKASWFPFSSLLM